MGVRNIVFLVIVFDAALCLLLLQPTAAQYGGGYYGGGSEPWLPPSYGDVGAYGGALGEFGPLNVTCADVDCGNGKCSMLTNQSSSSYNRSGSSYSYSYNYSYSFKCTCELGWNRSDHSSYDYLPCVLPMCNFSSNCAQNLTSFESKTPPSMTPFSQDGTIDPCTWAICGEGTCVKTKNFAYTCNCNPGFVNLLNVSSLPCYKPCPQDDPGADCRRIGVGMVRASSNSSNGSSGGNGSSDGSSEATTTVPPGKLLALFILIVSLVTAAS